MEKTVMYIILTITTAIGAYLPVLLGQSALGGWSILGSIVGGIIGVVIIYKMKRAGY